MIEVISAIDERHGELTKMTATHPIGLHGVMLGELSGNDGQQLSGLGDLGQGTEGDGREASIVDVGE